MFMNNKRTSVGVLCAALLAICVISLAAYISTKQMKREAEILRLLKEIDQAVEELNQTKERHRLQVEELERKAEAAEIAKERALAVLRRWQ